jgi:hypothetical protein
VTETVPIDEGEAEAQPDTPVITIRLLDADPAQADQFPRTVRFEIPARGKRHLLDQTLHDRAVRWLQDMGYGVDGEVVTGYLDVEGERVWQATYTIVGYV